MEKRKVLIVDEEAPLLTSLKQKLGSAHPELEFQTASNSADALRALATHEFDLLAADAQMPEVGGRDLLAKVVEAGLQIPVILLSSRLTSEMEREARRQGAFAVLDKPVDLDRLCETIHRGLNGTGEGELHGISLPGFLQLLQMETKTCRLRVRFEKEEAALYFVRGDLVHARWGDLRGEEAAEATLRWDPVSITMKGDLWRRPRTVHAPLTQLLLESAKHADEDACGLGDLFNEGPGASVEALLAGAPGLPEAREEPAARESAKEEAAELLPELGTVQGIVGAALLQLETGRCWTYGGWPGGDLEKAVADCAAVFVLEQETLSLSGFEGSGAPSLDVTLSEHLLLVRTLGSWGVLLAVLDRRAVSLALAMREIAGVCRSLTAPPRFEPETEKQ